MKFAHGFHWPHGAELYGKRYIKHAEDMRVALKYVRGRNAVVQAGGHVGVWPRWLSSQFDTVLTFEPQIDNYVCLEKNLYGRDNVQCYNAALSDKPGQALINFNARNIGGHSISENTGGRDLPGEKTKVTTINQKAGYFWVDLIVLDVEGFELPALKGGFEVIDRCSPVIMVEDAGHGVKKGRGDTFADLARWLSTCRYFEVERVAKDVIFQRRAT